MLARRALQATQVALGPQALLRAQQDLPDLLVAILEKRAPQGNLGLLVPQQDQLVEQDRPEKAFQATQA